MAKGKLSKFEKFLIVAGVLLVAEGVFYMAFRSTEEQDIREVIQKQVEQIDNVDASRKEQMKVQLALADYRDQNDNKLPERLDVLVPKYFDRIPIDPATGKPFKYSVDGQKYKLGGEGATKSASAVGKIDMSDDEQAALVASLSQEVDKVAFVYDPTNKRDPFRPFDLSPRTVDDGTKTALEKYDLGQLKLTAVLKGFAEPTALVENNAGKGFTVKKGTKIGTNNGEIVEILQDKILILETSIDFTGQTNTRTVELRLRTKDQDDKTR